MTILRYTIALALCAAMVGCSGSSKSSTNTSSGAASQATASAAQAGGGGGDSALPIYPGAKKASVQVPPTKYCGYNVAATDYQVGVSAEKVNGWYQGQMSGGTDVPIPTVANVQTYMDISADGANAALVMHVGGASEPTQIVLSKYTPPISSEDIQMMRDAHNANAADRAAMAAKMKAKCPPMGG